MLIYESAALSVIAYLILCAFSPWLRSLHGRRTYAALVLTVHVPWLLAHAWHAPLRPFVTLAAGTWIFVTLLCLAVGLPLLIPLLAWRLWRRSERRAAKVQDPADPSRRQALGNLALPAVAFSLGGAGALGGAAEFVVVRLELRVRNWPQALDGFCIGQITDTHVGDFISAGTVARAVDTLNDSGAHLQVMTGDLVDDLRYLSATFESLERCRAPYGMLAVLGNHEKMHSRLGPMLAAYATRRSRGQIRLLVDDHTVIQHNGAAVCVVGVDFPMRVNGNHSLRRSERQALMRASADTAFESLRNTDMPMLCLSHHPDFFPLAAARNVSLTLSGHTHGGQIAVAGKPLFTPYDFMLGHYRLGQSHLYVSGGTGHWLPVRYGVPTEVTVITLRSA